MSTMSSGEQVLDAAGKIMEKILQGCVLDKAIVNDFLSSALPESWVRKILVNYRICTKIRF